MQLVPLFFVSLFCLVVAEAVGHVDRKENYNNPTPLIAYNRFPYNDFISRYRAALVSTATSSSTALSVTGKCKSLQSTETCEANKRAGFCSDPDFRLVKLNCAVECGLCGKAADPCVDGQDNCAQLASLGLCTSIDPMKMEFTCAKTCGFCEHPN